MAKYMWVLKDYRTSYSVCGVFTTRKAAIDSAKKHYNIKFVVRRLNDRVFYLIDPAQKDDDFDGTLLEVLRFEPNCLYH